MPRPRKYFVHGSVVFVTFGLEQGLLLLANALCINTMKSCLAKSASLYKVRICHFIVHSNHVHMTFVIHNPSDVPKFIGHFKAEVAHRLNILLGWNKRTVWCEGYDSPIILSPLRALMAIAYLYANPAKDHQEDSIDQFPGLSSWKMFTQNKLVKKWAFFSRRCYRTLPKDAHNLRGYDKEAARIMQLSKYSHEFKLEPNAWLEAFGITKPEDQKLWNDALVRRIRTLEKRARKIRSDKNMRVIGKSNLQQRKMSLDYKPEKRNGRRMWCLSEKRSLRIKFILQLKELFKQAKEVYNNWHYGDYSVPYPPGLFPPCQPKLMEVVPGYR